MRRLLTIAASVTFFAMLALADTWTGKLVDATCMDQQKNIKACSPTGTTTAFLVVSSDGKAYKLDDAGNAKAVEALKNRADRTAPGAPTTTDIAAKISGTKEGDTIMVETIDVQ
jgi:hypothetical protein